MLNEPHAGWSPDYQSDKTAPTVYEYQQQISQSIASYTQIQAENERLKAELEAMRDVVDAAKRMDVPEKDREMLDVPWWVIIHPDHSGREAIMAGPFFSRASAEAELEGRRYYYGQKPEAWAMGGASKEYKRLFKAVESLEKKEGE